MNYIVKNPYLLILSGDEQIRKVQTVLQDGKIVKFDKLLNKSRTPKIYAIKINGELVYIGYTSQPINIRLNSGLKASGKNGYHGYKWKNESDQIELRTYVFFEKPLSGNRAEDKNTIDFVEAIEAELVFKFRQEKGVWPKYQNEIHFNNVSRKTVRAMAENIYKCLMA